MAYKADLSRLKFKHNIDGMEVYCEEDLPLFEVEHYAKHHRKKFLIKPDIIAIEKDDEDDEFVKVSAQFKDPRKFERIRRITGYLVGTLDRFNDAKRSEESQRVKHNV